MTVPCLSCGSRDTVILPTTFALAPGTLMAKLAKGLGRLAQSFMKKPLMGRYAVVCLKCGAKNQIYFN